MQSHHLSFSSKPVTPLKPLFSPKPGPQNVRFTVRAWAKTEHQKQSMYELLSVSENADPGQIKAAFRKLARKWHPDTCRSSENKHQFTQQFIQAREAYRVLSDPLLREDYDYRVLNKNGLEGVSLKKRRVRKAGFGDWEVQLEGLKRRSYTRATSSSWGSRMRASRPY
ncbi:chaperone protein dnaJ 20, chloroplastic-like [Tasmannia lanceolata]|uniref:chaperone protein dnaJ 20, chloroplastic-like n=1 Tax=Tasmannia lanceolata TaxID=3420 RepID=UPI004063E2A5